jgi:hypothetical protein
MNSALARLQLRVLGGSSLILAGIREVKDLKNLLRSRVTRAFADDILVKDFAHLIWSRKLPRRGRSEDIAVWGGVEVNQKRDPALPHFLRADGAWFDFHIELRRYAGDLGQFRGDLELHGYGYEIRFPSDLGCGVSWLRFDLNPPGHDNEIRNVRAHFHPGDDDLQAPSPVLHPEEALEILLSDLLHLPEKRRRTESSS